MKTPTRVTESGFCFMASGIANYGGARITSYGAAWFWMFQLPAAGITQLRQ